MMQIKPKFLEELIDTFGKSDYFIIDKVASPQKAQLAKNNE